MRTSLSELEAFLIVAEQGGFRRAAAMLHVSPSAISHAMQSLESRLGVRLLNRTTRSVALTEAGARFADRLRPALTDVDQAVAELRDESREVLGKIRITTMEHGAKLLIDRDIVGFMARYPKVEIELVVDVALTDLVAAGFDAGVRLREQVPADMIAVQLQMRTSFVAAASPAYLETHPAPRHPSELLQHRCIRQRLASGDVYRWEFEDGKRPLTIDPPGMLTLNNQNAIIAAALAGAGICYVPAGLIEKHVRRAELKCVLADFTPEFDGLCLYYPPSRIATRAFAALVEHLRTSTRRDKL